MTMKGQTVLRAPLHFYAASAPRAKNLTRLQLLIVTHFKSGQKFKSDD
jgi:hypothetical protein